MLPISQGVRAHTAMLSLAPSSHAAFIPCGFHSSLKKAREFLSCLAAKLSCAGPIHVKPTLSRGATTTILAYVKPPVLIFQHTLRPPVCGNRVKLFRGLLTFTMTVSRRAQKGPKKTLPTYLPTYRKRSKQTGAMVLDVGSDDNATSQNSSLNTSSSSASAESVPILEQGSTVIPSRSLFYHNTQTLRVRLKLKFYSLEVFKGL